MIIYRRYFRIEEIKIGSLIYEIRVGKQVILDFEISVAKCHYYLFDKITHYDIGKPIFNNFIMGGKVI